MKKKKGPSHAANKKLVVKPTTGSKKKVTRTPAVRIELENAPKQPSPPTSRPETRVELPAPANLPEHKLRGVSVELGLKLPTVQPKYGSLHVALHLTFDVEDATIEDAMRLHEHANNILADHLLSAQLVIAKDFGFDTGVKPEDLFHG